MAISIREHCVPAYDILSRLRKVAPIPPELDGMEQETGGIIKKIIAVAASPYFKALPNSAIIQSGEWRKADALEEVNRISSECINDLEQ